MKQIDLMSILEAPVVSEKAPAMLKRKTAWFSA